MKAQERLTASELAMYLGCEIMTPEGKGIIAEVTHKSNCSDSVVVFFEDIITKDYESSGGHTITSNAHRYYVAADEIKLILRPLSDMSEEEMKELYLLVFKRQFVGNNIKHLDKGMRDERHVLWSGLERLFIYADGDVGADCDLHHYMVHHPTVVKWQMSKGFDVFNLIPEGKALDKTKIGND